MENLARRTSTRPYVVVYPTSPRFWTGDSNPFFLVRNESKLWLQTKELAKGICLGIVAISRCLLRHCHCIRSNTNRPVFSMLSYVTGLSICVCLAAILQGRITQLLLWCTNCVYKWVLIPLKVERKRGRSVPKAPIAHKWLCS